MNPGNLDQTLLLQVKVTTRGYAGADDVWTDVATYPAWVAQLSASIQLLYQQRKTQVSHTVFVRDEAGLNISFKNNRFLWVNNNNAVLKPLEGSVMRRGPNRSPMLSILVQQQSQIVE